MNSKTSPQASVDLYAVLQVHRKASQEIIEAAYRTMLQKYRFSDKEAQLTQAYQILSNTFARQHYDVESNRLEGKLIGNYRVFEQIAEGGFGKTYKGEHALVGGEVCIKHCSEVSPENETILIEETRAMWNLRHFAIPSVRDLIKLGNGSLALVMSYIPGPTLAKIVEKYGRMDAEHVAWIAHRVINALMYMHSGGVIHGDIKPQNIIVQHQDHTIVIVDFGLAMIKPKRDDQSKGYTKLFSPPEQMDGGVLIPESDLYSLGMTMIYALSGGTKHGTENLEKQRVPNDVPKPLCEFIRRLVRPEPLDRPRVWKEENLFLTLEQVRMESFGRTNSGMKPLEIDL